VVRRWTGAGSRRERRAGKRQFGGGVAAGEMHRRELGKKAPWKKTEPKKKKLGRKKENKQGEDVGSIFARLRGENYGKVSPNMWESLRRIKTGPQ